MAIAVETTLRILLDEYRSKGIRSERDIAIDLLKNEPDIFDKLPEATRINALAEALRGLNATKRNSIIRSERTTTEGKNGTRESVMRISVSGSSYWEAQWHVGSEIKTTRELTPADIDVLIADYQDEIVERRGKVHWLVACKGLAAKHRAKALGDLEKKGIDLPSIEVAEDLLK